MTAPSGRVRPTYLHGERELLEAWLDFHRSTLWCKCEGLNDEQRKRRPVETSMLSLHGLLRHLAETERNWFCRILQEMPDIGPIWTVEGDKMTALEDADWDEDVSAWQDQCERSREIASTHALDDAGTWRRKDVTLRAIYCHMIQEYARHNGHADIIRELIDGSTGL